MPFTLIGVAQVGVGVDLDDSDWLAQSARYTHDCAVAERMLSAQGHRHFARTNSSFGALGEAFHDIGQGAVAVQWFFGEDALDTRFGMASDAFQLVAGLDDRFGAFGSTRAVGHSAFQRHRYNAKSGIFGALGFGQFTIEENAHERRSLKSS